jgi:hypothetical protein
MEKFYIQLDGSYWGSVVDSDELPFEGAVEVPHPPDTSAIQTWDGSAWSIAPVPPVDVLGEITNLITQGQTDLASDPLPADIFLNVCQLEATLQICAKREAWASVRLAVQSFVIPDTRIDVKDNQRALVATLKTQMLVILNGL